MSSKASYFLSKTLGEDFDSSLQKFELYKPGTRTVIDHEELRTALQIVPRAVLSLLISELAPMEIGENKEINLPVSPDAVLKVTKHERDVYGGSIEQANKKVVDIQYRSIPGIGLIIMSAFELYDVDTLEEKHPQVTDEVSASVQKMVDERMALHGLINQVVDKKIMERDAIQQLAMAKLTHVMSEPKKETPVDKSEEKPEAKKDKGSPLKKFLEQRKTKKPKEFHVEMHKGETVNCPDCGNNIFDGAAFSGCVCYGDCGKVHIKKTETGIKVRFGRGWDAENIEMLLETLWRKNGK